MVRFRSLGPAGRPVTAAAALLSLIPTAALAVIPPEIPLTRPVLTGARAAGMGGAYAAIAADVSALEHNPAGLAQIPRSTFGLALARQGTDLDNTYLGRLEGTSRSKTRLDQVGFAYPFPTYRGSLVFAASYQQYAPFDADYLRSGSGLGVLSETESITESGTVGAWQAGLAWEVSPSLSLGLSGAILAGDSDRSREFYYEGDDAADFESTITETSLDVTGLSGHLGLLYRGDRGVSAGVVVQLPQSYTLEGRISDDVIRYQENPPDTLDYIDTFTFEDDLTLPVRLTLGVAYSQRSFTVSAQATMTDWEEIDYGGPIRFERGFAYRSTADLRVGAEYRFRDAPLALRAGFRSAPLAYDLVGVDVFNGIADRARYVSDLTYWTVGAGYELDPSFQVDLAYVHGGYERSGRIDGRETVEERTESRMLVGVTFLQTR